MTFALHSPAFEDGSAIPEKYARDDQNVSPPLHWTDAPAEAKSFVLVIEDPDAPGGVFHHWAVHGIDASQTEIREGFGAQGPGVHQAVNDFGKPRYDGPQPPRGHGVHHYHFRLAALGVENLEVANDATAAEVWRAARLHMIDETEMVGLFERS
ncbi:YbhB/YbcL family Raf kinase inhibitor-like protein [Phenylobacterium sp. LjRoot219]|uniref:YbhB/YbcL family Raf kinase inhibitor-like protein n=1 Tax=Phenylobacterium sp. LjRoot219 TaxID=3342283 RepID=UPI003ED05DD9